MMEVGIKCTTAFGPRVYKLPAVKESLYHPKLPTFRRMDMDTAAHKLPDQHCRTTTPCAKGDFRRGIVTLNYPSQRPMTLKTGKSEEEILDDGKVSRFSWPLTTSPQKDGESESQLHTATTARSQSSYYRQMPLSQYQTRFLASSGGWRYTLRQEPYIDHIGQRPCPATIFSRHRSSSSSNGGMLSTYPWRP